MVQRLNTHFPYLLYITWFSYFAAKYSLLVFIHEVGVEGLEFVQHDFQLVGLWQNCGTEVICALLLAETAAGNNANT